MEAGADAIFPEALTNAEMFREVARRLPGVPLLANMTEFGRTPFFTGAEFEAMGYKMVIWPVSSLRIANKAQAELYAALKRDGGTQSMLDRMQTRAELYATIGYHEYEALDASIVNREPRAATPRAPTPTSTPTPNPHPPPPPPHANEGPHRCLPWRISRCHARGPRVGALLRDPWKRKASSVYLDGWSHPCSTCRSTQGATIKTVGTHQFYIFPKPLTHEPARSPSHVCAIPLFSRVTRERVLKMRQARSSLPASALPRPTP